MVKYLLDTCVWRDFYEDRHGFGKPLGKYAAELIMKILARKDEILFSDQLIWELRRDYDMDKIEEMISSLFFIGALVRIEITKEEKEEAQKLSNMRSLPFIDCLYAVQSRNHDAVMISQDKHFIVGLNDIVKTFRPQWIN